MIKTKVAFLRADFYPVNQSSLKSIKKALIGWKKAGPPKKPLLFYHVNRLLMPLSFLGPNSLPVLMDQPGKILHTET